MNNLAKTAANGSNLVPTKPSFEEQVLTRLELILARQDEISERLEAIEVRLSDMDLDTGNGFEIERD